MHIDKWHRQLKLFAWQHKRSLILTAMFALAVVLSAFLVAPAVWPVFALPQWPPEFWYVAIAGFFICVVVVLVND
ncbi:MAG TPA: hypothetical protein VFV64_14060 [Permianibacter sp.]|nr:hypothetical protein [Permianibacter sp.]